MTIVGLSHGVGFSVRIDDWLAEWMATDRPGGTGMLEACAERLKKEAGRMIDRWVEKLPGTKL